MGLYTSPGNLDHCCRFMQSAVLRHRCHHLGISQEKLKYFTKKSAALWLFSCLHSSLPSTPNWPGWRPSVDSLRLCVGIPVSVSSQELCHQVGIVLAIHGNSASKLYVQRLGTSKPMGFPKFQTATGRLNKPHLVLDRVLVPGYRQILAGRAQHTPYLFPRMLYEAFYR
jgi:hypothetical protein